MRIRLLGLFLVMTAAYGFTAMSANGGFLPEIPEGDCAFAIVKVTPQIEEESIPFEFIQTLNGVDTEVTILSNPDILDPIFLGSGETIAYTELSQEGWTLEKIECIEFGAQVVKGEDSVTFTCEGSNSFAFCAFINRVSADKIPTLSEWGMIAAAAGLGLVGVFFAVRRRRLQAGA